MIKKLFQIVFLLAYILPAFSQNGLNKDFSFPFKMGDSRWHEFSSNRERMLALQIPENRLSDIPTESLLEICLDYPFLLDIVFCDDVQEGIKLLISRFNGFSELIGRNNLPSILLAKERKLQEEVNSRFFTDEMSRGKLGFENLVVDLLFLHEDVFPNLTRAQKDEFRNVLEINKNIKNNYPDIFGGINNIPEKILSDKTNAENSNNQSLRLGPDYSSVDIYTPHGSLVPEAKVLTSGDVSYSTSEISAMANAIYYEYNCAQLLEAPTYKMNNQGYTWYTSLTSQKVVIGYSNAYADAIFWEDGSYIEVPEELSTRVRCFNSSGGFSAVREDSVWYVSKWGYEGPLVRHHLNDVPDVFYSNPSNRRFYMRNPDCSITGPELIVSGYGTYSVENLPTGFTTSWSVSDSYYNNGYNLLVPNYPTTGSCLIVRDQNHDLKNDTLTAEIKYNGVTIQTVTKTVSAYEDFWGQYYSGDLSGTINYTHYFNVRQGATTHISSPNFYGATVSYDNNATIPSFWWFSPTDGFLEFTAPINNNGSSMIIIDVNDGVGNYYQLYASAGGTYYMNLSNDVNSITVTLNEIGYSEKGLSLDLPWTVDIRNATTGELMATQSSTSRSATIFTLGWPKGIYIIKITIGKEVLTEKFIVK